MWPHPSQKSRERYTTIRLGTRLITVEHVLHYGQLFRCLTSLIECPNRSRDRRTRFRSRMSLATTTVFRTTVRRQLFHSTACARHLVGPPDPISNIRPAIYHQEDPSSSTSYGDKVRHPYSLKEFTQVETAQDYQVNLQKTQLDAFDHAFWINVGTTSA